MIFECFLKYKLSINCGDFVLIISLCGDQIKKKKNIYINVAWKWENYDLHI